MRKSELVMLITSMGLAFGGITFGTYTSLNSVQASGETSAQIKEDTAKYTKQVALLKSEITKTNAEIKQMETTYNNKLKTKSTLATKVTKDTAKLQQLKDDKAKQEAELAEQQRQEAEAKAQLAKAQANKSTTSNSSATSTKTSSSSAGSGSVYEQFKAAGGTDALWTTVVLPESGGNPNAYNPAGYRGLGQTMQSWGTGSVETQTKGMINYATSRYGSQAGAVAFRQAHGWW